MKIIGCKYIVVGFEKNNIPNKGKISRKRKNQTNARSALYQRGLVL